VTRPSRRAGDALRAAAVTFYVGDVAASIEWYREALGLEPVAVTEDAFPYAVYDVSGLRLVLEPAHAATDGHDSDRTGAAALNLVVTGDLEPIRQALLDAGSACTEIKRSPRFESFLVRDPDGHRVYLSRPRH
jgi:catechol 2,3-dioxygenase-like lactoylglutathione lyase family enzyme